MGSSWPLRPAESGDMAHSLRMRILMAATAAALRPSRGCHSAQEPDQRRRCERGSRSSHCSYSNSRPVPSAGALFSSSEAERSAGRVLLPQAQAASHTKFLLCAAPGVPETCVLPRGRIIT